MYCMGNRGLSVLAFGVKGSFRLEPLKAQAVRC
jgi:hypothetical protein